MSTPHFNLVASASSMGPIRQSTTAWARDFCTHNGEIIKVFGYRHMPSPADWWSAEKSSSATEAELSRRRALHSKIHRKTHSKKSFNSPPPTPTQPLQTVTTTKRKRAAEIAELANKCKQPPSNRSRPSSLPSSLPTSMSASLPTPLPSSKPSKPSKPTKSTVGKSTRVTRSSTKARSQSQNDVDRLKLEDKAPLQPATIPGLPPHSVPQELAGQVPQFSKTGAHCCGKHKRPFRGPKSIGCRDCKQSLPHGSMHVLPCGHALCRACLNDNAAQTRAVVNSRRAWSQVQGCRDQHENYLALGLGLGRGSADTDPYNIPSPSLDAKHQPLETSEYFEKALQLLNLWCCGMDTGIGDFQDCMDPENSAASWLVDQLLQDPESLSQDEGEDNDEEEDDADKEDISFIANRCGWPDCQSLLTSACRFQRDSAFTYHYCVQCSGVSLAKGHLDNIPSWS